MGDKIELTLVSHPQAYFRELVIEAARNQKLETQPETEFYLVNLLNQFMMTDRLYPKATEEGTRREEALAILLKEALEQKVPEQQRAQFRHIGDTSLYVAGFFQDSLTRKLVDVDYYIGMGETAYQHVAARVGDESNRALYLELAGRFGSFVDLLAEVSDKTTQRSEKDILRMYDLWVRTKSERAAKALHEAGILPNETIKKDWQ